MRIALGLLPLACWAAAVPLDVSGVRPGPVALEQPAGAVAVRWSDAGGRGWRAEFSLDPARPLLTSIAVDGKTVVERARPVYRGATGKRRRGWDAFFDFPPSHPQGTRQFESVFQLRAARARSAGDRLELYFDGLSMGIFQGGLAFTFYPGSRLIQQEAVVTTAEPDVAFYYDAGLRMAADADRRPGNNMETEVAWFDTQGRFQKSISAGPERQPVAARYRAIAARTAGGSLAVFPPPHQYFFARDFTTNMAHVWHRSWRGEVQLGIRQLPDDNTAFYPWMNAPPGTEQRLSLFLLPAPEEPRAALDSVLRYTNSDRFAPLPGYKTMAVHWHFAYTVQAMEKGVDWIPPFKPVLKDMGVDAAMIMDFHGDGHPRDLSGVRLEELDAYFRACRAQSDNQFLVIPAEEANVHLGGHWAVVFPKPVYWFMDRTGGAAFRTADARYGTVYRAGNAEELLEMVRREGGYMYQSHPRTKGSTGFPDKIRETEPFRDPRYLGAGWKAMPSDLSSARLGERALKLVDDMNNWGLRKLLLAEVDVFQIDATHELYAHMNVNYVRAPRLPDYDSYGELLEPLARGDFFVTTGEVLLPELRIERAGGRIVVRAEVRHTFPLRFAEVVWGDGSVTRRQSFPLDTTREFGGAAYNWEVEAPGWKWARVAVWDVAGNGAFTNPVWK
jgi:hypothetical protein